VDILSYISFFTENVYRHFLPRRNTLRYSPQIQYRDSPSRPTKKLIVAKSRHCSLRLSTSVEVDNQRWD